MVLGQAVSMPRLFLARASRRLAVSLAFFVLCAVPGWAQSPVSWAGPYLGIDVGGRLQETGSTRVVLGPYLYPELTYTTQPTPISVSRPGSSDMSPIGSIRGGFLWPTIPVVIGVEGEVGYGSTRQSLSGTAIDSTVDRIGGVHACGAGTLGCLESATDTLQIKTTVDWTGSLRARLGLAISGSCQGLSAQPSLSPEARWLSLRSITFSTFHFFVNEQPISASVAAKRIQLVVGPIAGVGLDFRIAPNWVLRGEYSFTALDDISMRLVGAGGSVSRFSTSAALHTFRAGIAYLF
jgi:opacity protein-like surface antigen